MRRHFVAAVLATLCSLVVAGTAAAWDTPAPPQLPPISHTQQSQSNGSNQGQIQILPIAPQLNAQNVNVLTSGGVDQGDANNANTGQASQQSNTQAAVQAGDDGKADPCRCAGSSEPAP